MNETLEFIAGIVDLTGPTPPSRQLTVLLRKAIESGQIPHGTKLPSFRQVADRLGISRSTVHRSFSTLTSQGYIKCVQGRSSTVESPFQASASVGDLNFQRTDGIDCSPQSLDTSSIIAVEHKSMSFEDQTELPSGEFLSAPAGKSEIVSDDVTLRGIRYAVEQCCRRLACGTFPEIELIEDPCGYEPLREAVADYLRRTRLVRCTKYDIAVVSGPSTRLDLIFKLCLNPGDCVALSADSDERLIKLLRSHGAQVAFIPCDEKGLDVSYLKELYFRPKLVYVTPSAGHSVMPLERRKWLADWAMMTKTIIVEDDSQSERWTGHNGLPSIQSMDEGGKVIYLSACVEITASLLKVASVVAPRAILQQFLRLRELLDPAVPIFEQQVLAEFIATGGFERMIAKRRERKQLLESANTIMPVVQESTDEVPAPAWLDSSQDLARAGLAFQVQ